MSSGVNTFCQNRDSREIGSYFSINPDDIQRCKKYVATAFEEEGDLVFFSTCRSAIKQILSSLKCGSKRALLPAFTCHAVVEPFVNSGYAVFPYPVQNNLLVNVKQFKEMVREVKPSVILIHDYFGFDTNYQLRDSGTIAECREKGVTVIVDMTQSMFSQYPRMDADYYVGSIRKWMGIPDGAFAKGLTCEALLDEDEELVEAKTRAMIYKHNYLYREQGEKANIHSLYRNAERILDSREKSYTISTLSKGLLSFYDIQFYKMKRRENCEALLKELKEIGFIRLPFKEIERSETPFYVPIMVQNKRRELQRFLADNGVFATIIWRCPDEFIEKIDDESKRVYNEILCIPCDQRYSRRDMKYIGELMTYFEEVLSPAVLCQVENK